MDGRFTVEIVSLPAAGQVASLATEGCDTVWSRESISTS